MYHDVLHQAGTGAACVCVIRVSMSVQLVFDATELVKLSDQIAVVL